jgi:hypothetical protein
MICKEHRQQSQRAPPTEPKATGRFTIIKAPDLDTALAWARRYALVTTLPIEVRPFQGEAED